MFDFVKNGRNLKDFPPMSHYPMMRYHWRRGNQYTRGNVGVSWKKKLK